MYITIVFDDGFQYLSKEETTEIYLKNFENETLAEASKLLKV